MMADQIFTYYHDLLTNRSIVDAHGCRLWTGGTHYCRRTRYGIVRAKLPGWKVSKPTGVHLLAYFISTKTCDIPKGLNVSHLCHNSLCINTLHLSLEPVAINRMRQTCLGTIPRHCTGHLVYPDCILFDR